MKKFFKYSLYGLTYLLIVFVLIQNIPPLLNWLFFDADFIGTSKDECSREGACWIFVNVWFKRFMYGLYPNDEIWRVNVSFIMLLGLVIVGGHYLVQYNSSITINGEQ